MQGIKDWVGLQLCDVLTNCDLALPCTHLKSIMCTSNLLGLRREDLYSEGYPDVVEAIRRLPETEHNLRNYRMKRALDLSLKHQILPKEDWTKPEEVTQLQVVV